jgi:hypothetical protein
VGEGDGVFFGKRYFSVPDRHALMVPADAVAEIIPQGQVRST